MATLIKEHQNGEKTQFVEDLIWAEENYMSLDSDELPVRISSLLKEFDNENCFLSGVRSYITKHFPDQKVDDLSGLTSFIQEQCKKHSVTGLSRQTLSNWFSKAAPNGNLISRRNVYKLCFALEMNKADAQEFFLTAYRERPFNYKDIVELVFAYALNNGISYREAENLINEAEKVLSEHKMDGIHEKVHTASMGGDLASIHSKNDLLLYLKEHADCFVEPNQTGTESVLSLLKECAECLQTYYEITIPSGSLGDTRILECIYGQPIRTDKKYAVNSAIMLQKTALPAYVRRNIPQLMQLSEIRHKKASFDSIRKAIILLDFYSFYMDALIKNVELPGFDQFRMEINDLLNKCGYGELYFRNPYDFIFLYCAAQESPLDAFHTLIETYCSEIQTHDE